MFYSIVLMCFQYF